jgi:hypothetical protein
VVELEVSLLSSSAMCSPSAGDAHVCRKTGSARHTVVPRKSEGEALRPGTRFGTRLAHFRRFWREWADRFATPCP